MPGSGDPQADASGCAGGAPQDGTAEPQADSAQAQLQAWLSLGGEALGVLEQLATVVRLELALAVGDGKRLLVVCLAMIPLALFAWLGLCMLLSFLVYAASAEVALGLLAFLLLQCLPLLLLWRAAQRYQRSLGLPASRRQWRDLARGVVRAARVREQDA